MRDKITLLQSNNNIKIEKFTKNIEKVLDEEESLWAKSQNTLTEEKLKNDAMKTTHHMESASFHSLFSQCKDHCGPFVSADEVDNCLKLEDVKLRRNAYFKWKYCIEDIP